MSGYRNEIITSASIVKRDAQSVLGTVGIKHYGVQVETQKGNSYLIHSTPASGTVVTDCKIGSNWSEVNKINVHGTKTVGNTFSHVSGRTNNKFVNYVTSGTCIGTAVRAESYLSTGSSNNSGRDKKGGIKMTKYISCTEKIDPYDVIVSIDQSLTTVHLYKKYLCNKYGIEVENVRPVNIIKGSYESFDIGIFNACLLMHLNGRTINFSISLDRYVTDNTTPIEKMTKLKMRLVPNWIVEERTVGNILFESDVVLKKLITASFDPITLSKLRGIGYKSFLEHRMEAAKKQVDIGKSNEKKPILGRLWLEATDLSITVVKDFIVPNIKYKINYLDESGNELNSDVEFTSWLTNNFEKLQEIFPIFKKVDELFTCYTVTGYLKHIGYDLSRFEEIAFEMEEIHKFKNHIFEGRYYDCKEHVIKETYKNITLSAGVCGGITNPFILTDRTKYINFRIKGNKIRNLDNNVFGKQMFISNYFQYKLEYGFEVNLLETNTIEDIYKGVSQHIKNIPMEWLEISLYEDILSEKTVTLDAYGFDIGETYGLMLNINAKFTKDYPFSVFYF